MVFPCNWGSASSKDGAPWGTGPPAGGIWELEAAEILGKDWVSSTLWKKVFYNLFPVTEVCLKHEYDCTHNNSKHDVEMFKQLKWWRRNWIAFCGFYFPHSSVGCSFVDCGPFSAFFVLNKRGLVFSLLPFAGCPQEHLRETGLGFFLWQLSWC